MRQPAVLARPWLGDTKPLLRWHRADTRPSPRCRQHLPAVAIAHLASQARQVKHGAGERILWQRPFLRGWMQLAGVVRAAFMPLLERSFLPWSPFCAWWARSAPSGFYQGQLINGNLVKWRPNIIWAVGLRLLCSPLNSSLFISPLISPSVGIHPGGPQTENLSSLCS